MNINSGKSFFLTFLLLNLAFISCTPKSDDRFPFFFVQMSDPQFGFFDENRGFEKETELYSKAIEEINRLNPAFVVITGDFVNNKSDQAQWDEFNRLTHQIDSTIPVYLTPGNHDIGQNPEMQDLERYKTQYGDDKFSIEYRGCQFIGFNSSIIKAGPAEMEQVQYEWLKNELFNARQKKHVVLFCHYPFFVRNRDEPESYSNIGTELRYKYLALFDSSDVRAVFSGHYHNNAYASYGDMELVITSAVGKPLAEVPSGIRIVQVYEERLKHQYYSLNEIPEYKSAKIVPFPKQNTQ